MTICVIENIPALHKAYALALRRSYPEKAVVIVPKHDKPCQTWKAASDLIDKASADKELVLVLDLMLKDQGDAVVGIEQSEIYRHEYPNAILIALTSLGNEVNRHPRREKIFDAVIDKQTSEAKDPEKLRERLYKDIEKARLRRTSIPTPGKPLIRVEDSLGMRLVEAAISADGLRELVEKETEGWSKIAVGALTSGGSGSHLLRLSGEREHQPARLVLKVATDSEILKDEGDKLERYQAHFNQFGGISSSSTDGIHQVDGRGFFYFRQVSVPGDTLYELIRKDSKAKASKAFDALLKVLIAQYRDAAKGDPTVEQCFRFRPDHPFRIADSCARLLPAAKLLYDGGEWPKHLPIPDTVFSGVRELTKQWAILTKKIKVPFWVMQHGDLHSGNVLVSEGQLRFIDLARFGKWPIGYDISRLATHARIHLPWQEGDRDWIQHDLKAWTKEEFAVLDRSSARGVCEWAVKADEVFRVFLEKRPEREHEELRRLYQFCALSDLMRILSYANLSHFKRIWTAVAIWQLGSRLGFLHRE